MKSLVYCINLIRWPLSFILYCLILVGEVTLLDCSIATKSSPKFTQLFVPMISNCDQPIVIVKDNGKSIHEPKVAIAFEARKSPNNIVMV